MAVAPARWHSSSAPALAACYGAGIPGEAHSASESAETWRIVDCAKVLSAFLYARLKA